MVSRVMQKRVPFVVVKHSCGGVVGEVMRAEVVVVVSWMREVCVVVEAGAVVVM